VKYGEFLANSILVNRYVLERGGDVANGDFNMIKAKGLLV
jgi:hypothetical protein